MANLRRGDLPAGGTRGVHRAEGAGRWTMGVSYRGV